MIEYKLNTISVALRHWGCKSVARRTGGFGAEMGGLP